MLRTYIDIVVCLCLLANHPESLISINLRIITETISLTMCLAIRIQMKNTPTIRFCLNYRSQKQM